MKEDNEEYKSLLIVNESNDAKVTLCIYHTWIPIPIISKIIQPNEKYLHCEKNMFTFELVANFDDEREKKEFPGPLEWIKDKLIKVTKSLEWIEENLADYPLEKRICLRKMYLRNELTSTGGKVNLYDILGLDMTEVRKLNIGDQKKAIKKAFRDEIKIWHPDKNLGDGEIASHIIVAKEILLDDERRACYLNEADYDKGWLSPQRFKAIFWPDCYTEEQNKVYWCRIGLMAASLGLAGGGVILTSLTAGAAAPETVVCGAIFGGGLTGAGMELGMHTISKNSIVNKCDAKSWASKAGIGFMGGAVTGGAAVGITAGVVGIGSAALESSAVTLGQYAGIGAASVASGGVASSLASDTARKFVDREEVTWKEFLGHATIGAGIGATAGALGGLATTGIVNRQTTAGSAALEGEVVEQAAILTGARRFGYPVAQAITRKLTESGTEAVMGTAAGFIEERLDDSVENEASEEGTAEEPQKATFRYRSEGAWFSKMIVTYLLNDKNIKEEVSGSGRIVKIPSDARQVKVRFQVRRPFWGDIMKYDRFKKKWCEPYEPHVFCYEKPPLERTFTISGNLWWEAVMRVSDEYHEETNEISLANGKSLDPTEPWLWEKNSKFHRPKVIKLREYGQTHPQEIKEINDVRVCFSKEFLVGRGSDATSIYVGLSRDGYERAVKRLARDDWACLAEQEKKILNEPNAVQSKYVVKYWYFDDKSDKDWAFLIMDICEETLNEYVERSSWEGWTEIARDIIRQVLKGLRDLHSCSPRSILHRDLKPSNILQNVHGKWLLADFGISRILREDLSTYRSQPRRAKYWRAVESCSPEGVTDESEIRYTRESDIQVAGMVAFYTVTKGEHPFGEEPDRHRNLLDGNPVYLDKLEDPAAKDLVSWMLKHDPNDRPTAKEALKHPYLLSMEKKFELLCTMGNQLEIKTENKNSDVVTELNNDPTDWKALMTPDVLNYLCTDFVSGKLFPYGSFWTECLRLIRNVNQHWNDTPRPLSQPEAFYVVGDPQEYFLKIFPDLPVVVHRIVRSCDWKERPDFEEFFDPKRPLTPSLRPYFENFTEEPLQKHGEIRKKNSWFKNYFLDSERNLKDEIHEKLNSFPWFCGAYGVTGPTCKISHLHLFLTVKRGTKKSDVRRGLQEKFECDAKEYFELLQEPKKKPKVKYLADSNDRSSASSSVPSVFPGGGVLACEIDNTPNPMNVEKGKKGFRATGTLTMFCFKGEHHYALTCCHVGSANDGDSLLDPEQRFPRDNNRDHESSAENKIYRFKETDENNNEAMSCDESDDEFLGDFHMCRWDSECDILSLKIPKETKVSCKITDAISPDWNSLWDEILENTESISATPLNVEKIGFKSAVTYGHIAKWNISYKGLFKNAIAVKARDPRPFLEDGDSGALVFFRDRNNMKKVFAYGVYEVGGLNLLRGNGIDGNSVSRNVEDSPSTSSEKSEDDEDLGADLEKSDDESEYEDDEDTDWDESDDDGVVFIRDTSPEPEPCFICFRLDTALKKLNLKEAACVNACARC